MEDRSAADVGFKQNNNDDDDVEGQIEGYNDPASSSSSMQGTSSKSRHQRKDGDDQLDEEDFERILSRTAARRLLALFEGSVGGDKAGKVLDKTESGPEWPRQSHGRTQGLQD